MSKPALIEEIDTTPASSPTLWWLGHSGFAIKFYDIVYYIDPCLESPLSGQDITNADLVLCTSKDPTHMDAESLPGILKASPQARVVLPKSAAEHACSIGIPYERMTTTDSDLRVEYFKTGLYGRVYSVPSAHPELDWTPIGGYPHLGYLIRFGDVTIYHAGGCRMYEGILDRLRPYNVTAALLPIEGPANFEIAEAAQLAEDIGARWLVPMRYGNIDRFVDHMLGFRPTVGFKVFEPGERWMIPT